MNDHGYTTVDAEVTTTDITILEARRIEDAPPPRGMPSLARRLAFAAGWAAAGAAVTFLTTGMGQKPDREPSAVAARPQIIQADSRVSTLEAELQSTRQERNRLAGRVAELETDVAVLSARLGTQPVAASEPAPEPPTKDKRIVTIDGVELRLVRFRQSRNDAIAEFVIKSDRNVSVELAHTIRVIDADGQEFTSRWTGIPPRDPYLSAAASLDLIARVPMRASVRVHNAGQSAGFALAQFSVLIDEDTEMLEFRDVGYRG